EASIAADPAYGLAWEAKGEQQAYEGDFDGGLASLDECLHLGPASSLCLGDELWIFRQIGACDRYEALARRWIAADPASPQAYEYLASALFATGAPIERVQGALEQAWKRTPDAERPRKETGARIRLPGLAGDFEGAAKYAAAYASLIAEQPDIEEHSRAARLRVNIAIESGRAPEAAK